GLDIVALSHVHDPLRLHADVTSFDDPGRNGVGDAEAARLARGQGEEKESGCRQGAHGLFSFFHSLGGGERKDQSDRKFNADSDRYARKCSCSFRNGGQRRGEVAAGRLRDRCAMDRRSRRGGPQSERATGVSCRRYVVLLLPPWRRRDPRRSIQLMALRQTHSPSTSATGGASNRKAAPSTRPCFAKWSGRRLRHRQSWRTRRPGRPLPSLSCARDRAPPWWSLWSFPRTSSPRRQS